jgi:hypothetical protein
MPDRKIRADKKKRKKARKLLRPGETRLKSAGNVVVTYKDAPAEPPEGKRIHPRRPLPRVPEAPAKDEKGN